MLDSARTAERLRRLADLEVLENEPLASRTRFAIGGPADIFGRASSPEALAQAASVCREAGLPVYYLGEGSNVVAADAGLRGAVLRYAGRRIGLEQGAIEAEAGAPLQSLVDFAIAAGLAGLHTLERIPGSVGGAVYGNAGAYGHSFHEFVERVRYLEGGEIRETDNAGCEFEYRESAFKRNKQRAILSCRLRLPPGDPAALRREADEIRRVRDEKFPPSMHCAGSIFKNLYLANLPPEAASAVPERAVREGKVASAFFLEQVGAKGMRRGGIRIAGYHANLIWNEGGGTAAELRALIEELKRRVRERFGFDVEEEVQYLGDFGRIGD